MPDLQDSNKLQIFPFLGIHFYNINARKIKMTSQLNN